MPFFLPRYDAAPLYVPNLQGTIAMGSFVVINGSVCRLISEMGLAKQFFQCNRFVNFSSNKHSPIVSGIGKNLQELVWDSELCYRPLERASS